VVIAVSDLDQTVAEMMDRGIDNLAVETTPGAGREPLVDPEGNTVPVIEVAADNAPHSSPERRPPAD
jgi:hypothetical protein